jgi:hypothetical protein
MAVAMAADGMPQIHALPDRWSERGQHDALAGQSADR